MNSTISGNIAQHGAGISANSRSLSSDVMITNCTITDNTASGTNSTGGGISVGANMSVTLFNSILSGNSANTAGHADSTGLLTSASDFNLIGEANGGTPGATGAGNQFNVTNPGLAPLADNGGPTWTHALLSTSPALDAGSDSLAPATDQRGVPRPIDLSSVSNGMGGEY